MTTLLKGLESRARAALMEIMRIALRAGHAPAPPAWGTRPYRVLFVRHDGIGDLIMSTGVLRAIARAHPGITVDVLTVERNAVALRGHPDIRETLVFAPGRRWTFSPALIRRVRRARYDVVVDGMIPRVVDGVAYHRRVKSNTVLLMLASRAPYRVGIGGRPNDFVYTLPASLPGGDAHHVRLTASLAAPFGVDPDAVDLSPSLALSAAERAAAEDTWRSASGGAGGQAGPRILVNIAAAMQRRRWPPERWEDLVRHLRTRAPGARILVMAPPDERAVVDRIAAAGGAMGTAPGLREAFALVATAGLLITPDTSIAHAASALGTPELVFLTRDAASCVPYRGAARLLFGEDAIATIPQEAVLAELDGLLAGLR